MSNAEREIAATPEYAPLAEWEVLRVMPSLDTLLPYQVRCWGGSGRGVGRNGRGVERGVRGWEEEGCWEEEEGDVEKVEEEEGG